MKTAEEILNANLSNAQVRQNFRGDYEVSDAVYKAVYAAMDEYGRQIALAFCASEEGVSPESLAANFDRFIKREGMV